MNSKCIYLGVSKTFKTSSIFCLSFGLAVSVGEVGMNAIRGRRACLGAGRLGIRLQLTLGAAFAVLCRLDYEFFFLSLEENSWIMS